MNTLKLIKEQACPSSYKETSQNEPEVPIKRQEIKQPSKRISEIRIITLADEASFHLKSMKKMKPTSLKTLLWARVPLPRDKTEETHDLCRILRDHKSINSISLTLWFQNQFEAQALTLTMQKLNCHWEAGNILLVSQRKYFWQA